MAVFERRRRSIPKGPTAFGGGLGALTYEPVPPD
jgi:hypothetical protein